VTDLDDLVVRLRERADSLADAVTASPDLAGRARAGGRRRLVRRRAGQAVAATCVCAALILAAVTSSAWLPHGSRRAPDTLATRVYDQVGDSPTRGDLASDTAYTASALAVWAASHATSANADRGIFDDLRGRGRVVWAGATPAGPRAIVAQQAFLHRHSNLQLDREGLHTHWSGSSASTPKAILGSSPTPIPHLAFHRPLPGGSTRDGPSSRSSTSARTSGWPLAGTTAPTAPGPCLSPRWPSTTALP